MTFNESVTNVSSDGSDFRIAGAEADTTVISAGDGHRKYTIVVSVRNLDSSDRVIRLSFSMSQDIKDGAGNALIDTVPTGVNDDAYALDTTSPTVSIGRRAGHGQRRLHGDLHIQRRGCRLYGVRRGGHQRLGERAH